MSGGRWRIFCPERPRRVNSDFKIEIDFKRYDIVTDHVLGRQQSIQKYEKHSFA